MLIDQARIRVKAGSGGDGCRSFYRDRRVRKGKPDGGYGGSGGNVIFKVDKNIYTLLDFQYNRHFKAPRGGHGSSNNRKGKNGSDLYIRVPPGTVIKDIATGLVLRDFLHEGEEAIVVVGGEGGKGNSKNRDATPGQKGETRDLQLELKLIADVGIIGYPNVGKSTFISSISSAKSKIASYPFTTKEPVLARLDARHLAALGIVEEYNGNLVFADMPGLIEGAHRGRGLGVVFLRHIERTKILMHMVDMAQVEGRDAYNDYLSINKELTLYGKNVSKKPQVVACNKMDLPGAKENFNVFSKKMEKKVFPISALTKEGIKELLDEIWRISSLADGVFA